MRLGQIKYVAAASYAAFKSWVTRDINRVAAASYAAETARSAAQGAATTIL